MLDSQGILRWLCTNKGQQSVSQFSACVHAHRVWHPAAVRAGQLKIAHHNVQQPRLMQYELRVVLVHLGQGKQRPSSSAHHVHNPWLAGCVLLVHQARPAWLCWHCSVARLSSKKPSKLPTRSLLQGNHSRCQAVPLCQAGHRTTAISQHTGLSLLRRKHSTALYSFSKQLTGEL